MYVCRSTVYDDPHIGNARPLVIFDILYKVLKKNYSVVTYVRNITDIDDKIIKSSQEKNISTKELTEKITNNFSAVTYVRNITDIDDKIIKSSQEKNISTKELTENVTNNFSKDCNFLNCENPTHQPKATEHIDLMIEMINELIKKNFN